MGIGSTCSSCREIKNAHEFLAGKSELRGWFGTLGVGGIITFIMVLSSYDMRNWTGFNWLKILSLWYRRLWNCWFHKQSVSDFLCYVYRALRYSQQTAPVFNLIAFLTISSTWARIEPEGSFSGSTAHTFPHTGLLLPLQNHTLMHQGVSYMWKYVVPFLHFLQLSSWRWTPGVRNRHM